MPDTRETIIRLDHDGKYAEIWTETRSIISRCRRFGYPQTGTQAKGVWLRLPIRAISIRKWPPTGRFSGKAGQFRSKPRPVLGAPGAPQEAP